MRILFKQKTKQVFSNKIKTSLHYSSHYKKHNVAIYVFVNGGFVFLETLFFFFSFSSYWSVIRVRLVHGFRCDSTPLCSLSGKALWYIRSMFKECHLNPSRGFSLIKRAIGIKPIHWICMFSPHIAENIFSNQLQTRAIRWVIALVWT